MPKKRNTKQSVLRPYEAAKLKKSKARQLAVARLAKLQKTQILASSTAGNGTLPEGDSPKFGENSSDPITAGATASYIPTPTPYQNMGKYPYVTPDNSLISPTDLTQESMNYQNPHHFLSKQAPYGNVSSRPKVIKGSQSAKANKVRVLGIVSKTPFLNFHILF